MKVQNILLPLSLLLFLIALSTGCTGRVPIGENISPEDSAVRYIKEMRTGGFTINIDSVEVIQKVELNNSVLVLIQYSGTRWGDGVETCVFVMEVEALFLGWDAHGGSGSCHKINDSTDTLPITVSGSRVGSSPENYSYSTVYGIIRDMQITNVVVTWEDEYIQQVEVKESTYIAVREGGSDMKKIDAFNDQNELVYTTNIGDEWR